MKVDNTNSTGQSPSLEPKCSASLSNLRNKVVALSSCISTRSSSNSLSSRSLSQITGADELSNLFDK